MLRGIIKHVHEFIGPVFPPYDHEFRESVSNMEFMLHVRAIIFYHRDIIGTKSTILVKVEWGSELEMEISKRYIPSGDRTCRSRCGAVVRSKRSVSCAIKLYCKIGRKEMKNIKTKVNLQR
jgi:hypothetical protein